MRVFGTPEVWLLHGQDDGRFVGRGHGACGHALPSVEHFHGERVALTYRAELGPHDELLLVHVGDDDHLLEPLGVHRLHPHRLPDASGAGIDTSVRLEPCALLAARLFAAAQVVHHLHHEAGRLAGCDKLGNVGFERRARAAVAHHAASVDIDGGLIVHGTEVEQDALPFPCLGHRNLALVPDAGDEIRVCYARQFALRAERHGDAALEPLAVFQSAVVAGASEVECVGPCAVEVEPLGALKLWAWILGAWHVGGHSPLCEACQRHHRCQSHLLEAVFHVSCAYLFG